MASSINPITSPSTTANSAAPSSSSSAASASALSTPSESMFLNLLVKQIQNQDPLNPTDSTQFVSQLAQFSELEQVIGIRSDTDQLATAASTATTAATTATTNGTNAGTNTNTTPATGTTNAAAA